MKKFKITFRCDADGENFHVVATLPFLPQIGMQIVALKGDNFRKVDQLYWCPADGFEVYFEDDEVCSVRQMKQFGWRVG